MNWLLAAGGVVFIVTAMIDALWTTIATSGGGPMTSRLSQGVWHLALRLHRRDSHRSHEMLQAMGSIILMMIIGLWIILLWSGWVMLFAADPVAVVTSQEKIPAELAGRVYFTGYTLFTLGIGNYIPQGGHWEVLTAVASLNGLFLITLAITYLVPVVSAAVEKHQLAAAISDLGRSPMEILTRAWDGRGFSALSTPLTQLLPMLELHTQRHLAYPVLHYFHSRDLRTALSPSIAVLDEALLLLTVGVKRELRLTDVVTEPIQHAVAGLLRTLESQYIRASNSVPPVERVSLLEAEGIPSVDQETVQARAQEREKHRRLLLAFVNNDGWGWDDVRSD